MHANDDKSIAQLEIRKKRAPKSRSGCVTCKYRHKKCDETKPSCTQCTSTGRTCDYLNPISTPHPVPKRLKPAKKTPLSHTQNIIRLPKLIPAPTFGSPFLSHELPHFEYFLHLLTISSNSLFSTSSFQTLVLQLSHQEICIRHAIIAISALLKYQSRQHHPSVNGNRYKLESHVIFGRAVEGLNRRIGDGKEDGEEKWEIALVGALLFATFEMLGGRGDNEAGWGHFENGGRVLRERLRSSKPSDTLLEIYQTFQNLDSQLADFDTFWSPKHAPPPQLPTTFSSLYSARKSLNEIIAWMWHTFKPIRPCTQTLPYNSLPAYLSTNVSQIESLLSIWERTYTTFLSTTTNTIPENSQKLLRIHFLTAQINIQTMFYREELAYDAFTSHFNQILALSTSILSPPLSTSSTLPGRSPTPPKPTTAPAFTFETALIPSLYLTALKCRSPTLRRQALILMENCGLENIWDGRCMAVVANWIMELEENSASLLRQNQRQNQNGDENGIIDDDEDFIPEASRVRELKVIPNRESFRVLVVTRRRTPGVGDGWEYFGKWIGWGSVDGESEKEVKGGEKRMEDEVLINVIGAWRADFMALDFFPRIKGKMRKGREGEGVYY